MPGRIGQLDTGPTCNRKDPSSIPRSGTSFRGNKIPPTNQASRTAAGG